MVFIEEEYSFIYFMHNQVHIPSQITRQMRHVYHSRIILSTLGCTVGSTCTANVNLENTQFCLHPGLQRNSDCPELPLPFTHPLSSLRAWCYPRITFCTCADTYLKSFVLDKLLQSIHNPNVTLLVNMAHITFRETGIWERLGAQNSICKANMYVATILCLVTCVEEAILVDALCCCLRVLEVPLHELRSPYPDLTILIWAQRLPCLDIHNLEGRQIGLGV